MDESLGPTILTYDELASDDLKEQVDLDEYEFLIHENRGGIKLDLNKTICQRIPRNLVADLNPLGANEGGGEPMKDSPEVIKDSSEEVKGSFGRVKGSFGPIKGRSGSVRGRPGPIRGRDRSGKGSSESVKDSFGPVKGSFGPVKKGSESIRGKSGPIRGRTGPGKGNPGSGKDRGEPGNSESAHVKDTNESVKNNGEPVKDRFALLKSTPELVKVTPGSVKDSDEPVKDSSGSVKDSGESVKESGGPVKDRFALLKATPELPKVPVKDSDGPVNGCGGGKESCADHAEYHACGGTPIITDEYHYLKTGKYTSEVFKVLVKNLPQHVPYGAFRACMSKIVGFKPRKVIYSARDTFAYLTFRNEDEREQAIEKLHNRVWKKSKLECKKAAPAADPFVRENKRKQKDMEEKAKRQKLSEGAEKGDGENDGKKEEEKDERPPEERILHVVCPYASKSYEEQLSLKQEELRSFFQKLTGNMLAQKIGRDWISKRNDELCVDLLPIIRSPKLENYRNKVEFTIGRGPDGKDNTVGFRLGSYREGNLTIVEPTKCINCSQEAIQIGKEFQEFIQGLPHPSFNPINHEGFWQQLAVRTCTTGDLMLIIQHAQDQLSEEEVEGVEKSICDHFISTDRSIKVTSIYMSSSSKKNNTIDTFKHLAGEKHITETLLNMKFRISPEAFFQVNTPAAEILYKTIHEWCDTNVTDACVLDVCCGTGTIGLCIANGTNFEVHGLEICEQAIEDAKYNAAANGIKNADFIRGPAEDYIYSCVKGLQSKNIIAVVDPPRAGLRRNIIETLRSCSKIKKIIYVSCSPKQASGNFLSFCRPESKRFQGFPFRMTRAVPVDLFPHTPHCELIVELVRYDPDAESEIGETAKEGSIDLPNPLANSCGGEEMVTGERDDVDLTNRPMRHPPMDGGSEINTDEKDAIDLPTSLTSEDGGKGIDTEGNDTIDSLNTSTNVDIEVTESIGTPEHSVNDSSGELMKE